LGYFGLAALGGAFGWFQHRTAGPKGPSIRSLMTRRWSAALPERRSCSGLVLLRRRNFRSSR